MRARTPQVVRRWTGEVVTDFTSRFSGLRRGLRVLFLGGVVPMAMFCLVFIAARQAGVGVLELWRVVLGPMDRDTGVAFSPWLRISAELVEYVLLAGLLAAAIQQIQVRRARVQADQATAEAARSAEPV
ncbi:hypothetical protein [Nocardioides daphniae]|uniref:Uncharacterized protein n=1 Tax=Nocardioides daphniae TaxID=402297 RepID=A0A4V1CWF5_9ACTN|nr:hypothetical protein [Nocardioides daphniae]QCC77087.1 hypothetical protein E2C04_07450 [Nocardioides daphniae]